MDIQVWFPWYGIQANVDATTTPGIAAVGRLTDPLPAIQGPRKPEARTGAENAQLLRH